MKPRKYVTAFAGARDAYQVPLALANSNQLECLVTDLYLPQLPAAFKARFAKLAGRSAPGLPVWNTRSSPSVLWETYGRWRLSSDRNKRQLLSIKWCQDELARLAGERAKQKDCDLFLYAGYALRAFEDPALADRRRILFMYHPHIGPTSDILRRDASHYKEAESTLAELTADAEDRDVDRELELADLVVCASEFTANTLRTIGIDSSKLKVIPYGIDAPTGTLGPKSRDQCHFLFVGSGIHRKGLHVLADAWRRFQNPHVRLTLVCRSIEPWIRARTNIPGLSVRAGVTSNELNTLYDDANVFVLPSLVEGFAYVYLEALARGCFCIGTRNTGLPDLGLSEGEASTVPSGDADALAEALDSAYQRWRSRDLDPAQIRTSVDQWSWSRFRTSIAALAAGLERRAPSSASLVEIGAHPTAHAPSAPVDTGRLRFVVLQVGARMHYAVPALLARAGMLVHFYTDVAGNVGLPDVLRGVVPKWIGPASFRRLLARRIPTEIPRGLTTTAEHLSLRDALVKQLSIGVDRSGAAVEWLRQRMIADDFYGANALYCLDNGDIDLIRAAKARGMAVVYEQVITPDVGRILREERLRFPGIEPQDPEDQIEDGIRRDKAVWSLADRILAPSHFVRESMIALGADPKRIEFVPYGLPENWYGVPTEPIVGRILFVGSVGLRKGNHYFAEAWRILRSRGVDAEFRVVGRYDARVVASPFFVGPKYVGLVARDQIREEFARADIFALPTIAEGFALVHLEAMAYGIPVITTPACGPAVRDGQDGFIVPTRDATALADRLELIIRDRSLRNRMGESARARATEYSWTSYRTRLIDALAGVTPGAARRLPSTSLGGNGPGSPGGAVARPSGIRVA